MKPLIFIVSCLAVLAVAGLISTAETRKHLDREGIAAEAARGRVQEAYQARADLVPALLQTVSGAASNADQGEAVSAWAQANMSTMIMRSAPTATACGRPVRPPISLNDFQTDQSRLDTAISRLLADGVPGQAQKANSRFLDLRKRLAEADRLVSLECRNLNEAVAAYNDSTKTIPGAFLARTSGYRQRAFIPTADLAD